MTDPAKDTIYIDIDDEITSIIEKLRTSNNRIVAMVLPKRAAVLQSIVNMKLLKRAADDEKKNLVLITSESGLLPLAGTVGLHVAKNLQSKPEIPALHDADDDDEEVDDSVSDEDFDAETASNKSVGELARLAPEDIETIELDEDDPTATEASATLDARDATKDKKNKKLAVPNFERFRKILFIGLSVLIVLVVAGAYVAVKMPRASIVVATDTSDINTSLTFTAETAAKTLNTTTGSLTVPAVSQQLQKTQNQQVNTTGQQNNGDKASGSVDMVAQACAPNLGTPDPIRAGSGVSSGGLTFITQEAASFSFDHISSGSCAVYKASDIAITAQAAGTKYNLDSATFAVAGYSSITASGSTSGGTDNIIQVVAQSDIDNATQKIAAQDTSAIKQQLATQLTQAGLMPLSATFNTGTPSTTSSANVGDQATSVTVTQAVTYTMIGVKQSDLKTLVDNDVNTKIDPGKQVVLSEGLDKASFHVNSSTGTSYQIAMTTTAVAGPDLNADRLKKQIAGKKSGEVRDMIKSNPGVSDVEVNLSPFWVTSVPTSPDRVTITFQKSKQ